MRKSKSILGIANLKVSKLKKWKQKEYNLSSIPIMGRQIYHTCNDFEEEKKHHNYGNLSIMERQIYHDISCNNEKIFKHLIKKLKK